MEFQTDCYLIGGPENYEENVEEKMAEIGVKVFFVTVEELIQKFNLRREKIVNEKGEEVYFQESGTCFSNLPFDFEIPEKELNETVTDSSEKTKQIKQ